MIYTFILFNLGHSLSLNQGFTLAIDQCFLLIQNKLKDLFNVGGDPNYRENLNSYFDDNKIKHGEFINYFLATKDSEHEFSAFENQLEKKGGSKYEGLKKNEDFTTKIEEKKEYFKDLVEEMKKNSDNTCGAELHESLLNLQKNDLLMMKEFLKMVENFFYTFNNQISSVTQIFDRFGDEVKVTGKNNTKFWMIIPRDNLNQEDIRKINNEKKILDNLFTVHDDYKIDPNVRKRVILYLPHLYLKFDFSKYENQNRDLNCINSDLSLEKIIDQMNNNIKSCFGKKAYMPVEENDKKEKELVRLRKIEKELVRLRKIEKKLGKITKILRGNEEENEEIEVVDEEKETGEEEK